MLWCPPPMGVVVGPLRPTRVISREAKTSSGINWPCSARARTPASTRSQSTATPVASTARTEASATSGPIPSPGMSVIKWAIYSYYKVGGGFGPRLVFGTPPHGGYAASPAGYWRRAGAGRHAGNSARGIRSAGVAPGGVSGCADTHRRGADHFAALHDRTDGRVAGTAGNRVRARSGRRVRLRGGCAGRAGGACDHVGDPSQAGATGQGQPAPHSARWQRASGGGRRLGRLCGGGALRRDLGGGGRAGDPRGAAGAVERSRNPGDPGGRTGRSGTARADHARRAHRISRAHLVPFRTVTRRRGLAVDAIAHRQGPAEDRAQHHQWRARHFGRTAEGDAGDPLRDSGCDSSGARRTRQSEGAGDRADAERMEGDRAERRRAAGAVHQHGPQEGRSGSGAGQSGGGGELAGLKAMKTVALLVQFALAMCVANAQNGPPAFEVASVKINDSTSNAIGGTYGFRNGSVSVRNITLNDLIYLAYGVEDYRVSGGPGWISVLRYNVDAKPAAPAGINESRLMLQALLAERFALQLHRETRTVDGYTLTAPKGSSKLQKSDAATETGFSIMSLTQMRGKAISMRGLVRALKADLSVPVEDGTGIAGLYEIALDFTLDGAAADGEASIFAVLKERLGLVLKRDKVPIEMLVSDRAEKPTAN